MNTAVVGQRLVRREIVSSTMDEAALLEDGGAPEGTVVVAEFQVSGVGRSGRSWQAPSGTSLLLSVVLHPPVQGERLGTLPLAAGVAVAEAIEEVIGVTPPVRLKWPNDLWIDERKVGGILLKARAIPGTLARVILGVGVNVNVNPEELPPGATSLAAVTGSRQDRDVLLHVVLERIDAVYRDWRIDGGTLALAAWRERAALVGEAVVIEVGDRRRAGVLRGIDDRGAMLLEVNGRLERIISGDLVRGPRRSSDGLTSRAVYL